MLEFTPITYKNAARVRACYRHCDYCVSDEAYVEVIFPSGDSVRLRMSYSERHIWRESAF